LLSPFVLNCLATAEYSPEKAGVGGSTPSLATMFSTTYEHRKPQLCPTLSQKIGLSRCLPQHLVIRNSRANLTGHFGWCYRRRVSAEIRRPSFTDVEYWQISSFATMRSSVRSRLAPPHFQSLRALPHCQSVPFCFKTNSNSGLAGRIASTVFSGFAIARAGVEKQNALLLPSQESMSLRKFRFREIVPDYESR
jgi:hypothetical protein